MTCIMNDRFNEHKACKTYAGARKRISNFLLPLADDDSTLGREIKTITFAVLQRSDGQYFALAFLRHDLGHWSNALVHHNICVTN